MSGPAVHHVNQRHWCHRWRQTPHAYRECIGCGMRSHWDGADDPCAIAPGKSELLWMQGRGLTTSRLDDALERAKRRLERPDKPRTARSRVCVRGHIVAGTNIYWHQGHRRCRACRACRSHAEKNDRPTQARKAANASRFQPRTKP